MAAVTICSSLQYFHYLPFELGIYQTKEVCFIVLSGHSLGLLIHNSTLLPSTFLLLNTDQIRSEAQSCLTLCDPMNRKPTNIYCSFNIILSSRITVLNQTHRAPVCIFYNHRSLSPFSSSPCTLFLYEAFYEHFSPQWSLSSIQSFYHPWGCLPIHAEPSVRKCEDVSWEILDIKSILELDSVCLFPSPPT